LKKIQIYFGNKLYRFKDFDELYEYVNSHFNLYSFDYFNYESYLNIVNVKLYESVLFSSDIDKVISIVNKKYNIDLIKEKNNTIKIYLIKHNKHFEDIFNNLSDIKTSLYNLGWNISHINYDNRVGFSKNGNEKDIIELYNSKTCSELIIFVSALNDIELENIPKKLYHVSLDYLENKIKKQGLKPMSKNKINKHNDRVYFFINYDINVFEDFVKKCVKNFDDKLLKFYSEKIEFNVYEIDSESLSDNLRLFFDPFYKNNIAVYTSNGIPPTCIKIIDKISIKK